MQGILDANTATLLQVERAIGDLRRGFAVAITLPNHNTPAVIVFAADTVSEAMLQAFAAPVHLVLSSKRIRRLFPQAEIESKCTKLPLSLPIDIKKLYLLTGLHNHTATPPLDGNTLLPAEDGDTAALELVKLAELLPAALVIPFASISEQWLQENHVLTVNAEDITHFKTTGTQGLREVCAAPLCLKGAEDAAIRVYRPTLGGNEHYAIIIGTALQDSAPLVRVHSSCYTGDLLDSLRCDCGDQLHEAIRCMGSEKNGGIILYLMQEGRGIGLTNKLRAYALQATGLDTVDANETLGFDDDERLFLPAAMILRQLGLSSIRLLTNNPKKAKGLEEHGIKVIDCVPHIMQPHQHNKTYLETKATRLGHILPIKK